MAYSESKKCGLVARLKFMDVFLLCIAFYAAIADAANQKVSDGRTLAPESRTSGKRENADLPRRPLLRQENILKADVPNSIEISSRGRIHHTIHGASEVVSAALAQHKLRQPSDTMGNHTEVEMPEDDQAFSLRCVDYPRNLDPDAADPITTGQMYCSGDVCKKDEYLPAGDQCCNCEGGAQFRAYENTQCLGESGLSPSKDYKGTGKNLTNPQDFSDVLNCMDTCWAMGEECTAFSVINEDSEFSGKCFFRKGALKYIHNYKDCYNATCEEKQDEVDLGTQVTTTTVYDNDTRLVFCDPELAFENIPCTENRAEARPKTHTTTVAPPTQDEVVDNRDCFVKYLWWR